MYLQEASVWELVPSLLDTVQVLVVELEVDLQSLSWGVTLQELDIEELVVVVVSVEPALLRKFRHSEL
jgi:hypothetical protein